jgi:hypothetical protein
MVIEACRVVLTERCRLMCKQRGRQHLFSYYVIEQPVLAWGRSLIKPPRRERTPAHTPKPASPRA